MNPFDELTKFKDLDGTECYYVKPLKLGAMIWVQQNENSYRCERMDFSKVNKELLIEADIWSDLNDSTQVRIEEAQKHKVREIVDKMEVVRKARRPRNPNLPTELTCKTCEAKTKANWSLLNKKADKLGIPAIELAKNYQCQKCNPTKGRAKGKGKPDVTLTCKCGFSVTYPNSLIVKMADKKDMTVGQLQKAYQCQKCNPTKGRKKKK